MCEYLLNKYIYNSSKKKGCEYACFPMCVCRMYHAKNRNVKYKSKENYTEPCG